jgi:hypothetical protein
LEKQILYRKEECEECFSPVRREKKGWRCRNSKCRKIRSIFIHSFFAKVKIDCCEILLIGRLWLAKSSFTTIEDLTGHSRNTIADYMNFYRKLIAETLEDEDTMIGGHGIIVEIDECKLGKRKYHRGHRVEGVWVIGGIEKTQQKRIFIEAIADRSAQTLRSVIIRHVRELSIIRTDLWRGYNLEGLNMTHQTVNHSENFVDPITGVHTNTIEGFWNGLKYHIAPRNRNQNDIDEHLLEEIWRRKHQGNLWNALLDALKTVGYFE